MAVVEGTACRSDLPVRRWNYESQVAKGAWDEWLEDMDKDGYGKAVFGTDHLLSADRVMASTDNGTFELETVERDGFEYLLFRADLLEDGDEDRTDFQTRMLKQFRSGRVKQVSVGFLVMAYSWEFASDEDSDLKRDRMTVTKAALIELSAVVFGAQEDEAAVTGIAMSAEFGRLAVNESRVAQLQGGPVRLYTKNDNGEPELFDMKASRDKAYAEHLAAKSAAAENAADKMTANSARARIASRERGRQ